MPGPDEKAEKKKIEAAKKEIHGEVKKLAQKTKKKADEARELMDEKKENAKKKPTTPDEKKRVKEVEKKLKDIQKIYSKEAEATSKRISTMLKNYAPDDKAALPAWQKGMDRWYIDILNKEPGFDLGGGVRANGDISIKDKKAKIDFSWKF
ncbi:MAG: hypothetical protein WBN04_19635 [Paracoccaceae bacterium]